MNPRDFSFRVRDVVSLRRKKENKQTQSTASKGPQPFSYQSGKGKVIKGWDDGVGTMKLGEKAKLTIPWQYGYGDRGHPGFSIPPKADLVFELEVLKIQVAVDY